MLRGTLQAVWSGAKHATAQKSQLLQPIIKERPFQLLGMDYIGPLPITPRGNRYILHVMCYFSEFSFASAGPTALGADTVSVLKKLFDRFTRPRAVYCDLGHHFRSEVRWALEEMGIRLISGPSGASKSFGLIERGNRILQDVIRKSATDWDTELDAAIYAVNHRVIAHLGIAPVTILIGAELKSPLGIAPVLTEESAAELLQTMRTPEYRETAIRSYLDARRDVHETTLNAIKEHKAKMAARYNRRVKLKLHSIGDLVMPYQKGTSKLQPRWRGPFLVRGIGTRGVSYYLSQLNGTPVRNHYHGDHLRSHVPRTGYLRTATEPHLLSEQNLRHQRRRL